MKFLKALGGVLCFVGCVIALAGILATAVPLIDNVQVQRIVDSFSMVSTDRFVNLLNKAILFCLAHNNWVFAAGAALLLAGGLMRSGADRALFRANAPRTAEARPTRAEPPRAAVPPQPAEAPVPPQDKPAKPLSPYATAEYGRALTRDANGRVASELAEKYKPRSIIDLPAEPETEADEPMLDRWRAPAEPEPAPAPVASEPAPPAHMPQRVCLNCGSLYAADASYCPHCGLSLQAADTAETQPGMTTPYTAAAPVPPNVVPVQQTVAPGPQYTAPVQQQAAPVSQFVAPVQQHVAPIPQYTAPVQQPVTAIPMPAMPPQASAPAYPETYQTSAETATGTPAPIFTAQPNGSAVPQAANAAPETWQDTPSRRQPRIVSTVQGVAFTPAEPVEAQSMATSPEPAAAAAPAPEPLQAKRPRIVSTMGRKRES